MKRFALLCTACVFAFATVSFAQRSRPTPPPDKNPPANGQQGTKRNGDPKNQKTPPDPQTQQQIKQLRQDIQKDQQEAKRLQQQIQQDRKNKDKDAVRRDEQALKQTQQDIKKDEEQLKQLRKGS